MSTPRVVSFAVSCAAAVTLASSCTRTEAIEDIPVGTEVTVMTQDGTLVRGKIAKVEPEVVRLTGERPDTTTAVARTSIADVKRVSAGDRDDGEGGAVVRSITIPDDTVLDVELGTPLASDTSRVEDRVRGTLSSPVVIDGATVIPAGAALTGAVTNVKESGKVKGRAELGVRFDGLQTGPVTYDIDTRPLYYVAESTRKDDALKIGAGAAAGAVIGAIAGGRKGAAIGSAIGAGGGTAVVLATDGDEIRLAAGRKLKVSLTSPLTIRTK